MDDDPESELVRQFRVLAGAEPNASTLRLEVRGQRFEATYSGGTSSSLTLSAPYAPRAERAAPAGSQRSAGYRAPAVAQVRAVRPMRILLCDEDDADRDAKERGVAREVQTGEPAFDAAVYIDSPSEDRVIQWVLAAPELRAGVVALIAEGFAYVEIDDDKECVVAKLSQFARAAHAPDRAARIADAFAAILANLPHVERSDAEHAPDNLRSLLIAASALAVLLVFAAVPLYFALAPAGCIVSDGEGHSLVCTRSACCDPIPMGVALGLLAGFVLAVLVPRGIRGRSNSHRRATWARVVLVALAIELGVAIAAAVYWR